MCNLMQMFHPRNRWDGRSAPEDFVCSKTVEIWKLWRTPSPYLRMVAESRDLARYRRPLEWVSARSSLAPLPGVRLRVGSRRLPLWDSSDGASQPEPPGLRPRHTFCMCLCGKTGGDSEERYESFQCLS